MPEEKEVTKLKTPVTRSEPCRLCGIPLYGAFRRIGVCVDCVNQSRYKKVTIKAPRYDRS